MLAGARILPILLLGLLLGCGLLPCRSANVMAQSVYPTPPPKQNVYEGTARRGIWDYNFTDAKSGLFWTIPDQKDSTGKAGGDKNPPDYPRIHYPTEMFLEATFADVEQLEQRVILNAKDDPTRVPIKITAAIVDMYGRDIQPGIYAIALRQANPNPPATLEGIKQADAAQNPPRYHAGMYDEASMQGTVEVKSTKTQNTANTRVMYPHNDFTRQAQQNPFFLHNPRLDAGGGVRYSSQRRSSSDVDKDGKVVPLRGKYLIIKHQGVVKGVLPVASIERYRRKRGQQKTKPAFATMSHDWENNARLALFYKSSVYQAMPLQQQLPVDYPQPAINNDADSSYRKQY